MNNEPEQLFFFRLLKPTCLASYLMNSELFYEYGEGPRLKQGTEDEKSTASKNCHYSVL